MKKISFIIIAIVISVSCKKNITKIQQPPTDAKLLTYLDSMLAAVGVGSYHDVLQGKMEGNIGVFANYYPIGATCYPFVVNTQLGGNVSIDTLHRLDAINAGDLYINSFKLSANDRNAYEIYTGSPNYESNRDELNKMYGKNNTIKLIKDGTTIFNKTIYIPKYIVMQGYNCSTYRFGIDDAISENSILKWNADYNNLNGVVIEYYGKDNTGVGRYSYSLAPDNGSYKIKANDLSIYPKVKNPMGIEINLIRGSFLLTVGTDNRKYNFNVTTNCGYTFLLK